jgi:hypothetical protein
MCNSLILIRKLGWHQAFGAGLKALDSFSDLVALMSIRKSLILSDRLQNSDHYFKMIIRIIFFICVFVFILRYIYLLP